MNIVVRKKIEEVKSKLDFRSQTPNPRSSSDMNDFGCRIFRTPIIGFCQKLSLSLAEVFYYINYVNVNDSVKNSTVDCKYLLYFYEFPHGFLNNQLYWHLLYCFGFNPKKTSCRKSKCLQSTV